MVYLTAKAPSKLADELIAAGYRVWEALEVSEALYLCEREHVDAVVIDPEIEQPDLVELQFHVINVQAEGESDGCGRDLGSLSIVQATGSNDLLGSSAC